MALEELLIDSGIITLEYAEHETDTTQNQNGSCFLVSSAFPPRGQRKTRQKLFNLSFTASNGSDLLMTFGNFSQVFLCTI